MVFAFLFFSMLLSARTQGASGMTAAQVIAKNLAARGGAAHFAAVRTLHFTGHIQLAPGQSAGLEVWLATAPKRIRIEVNLPAGKLVQAFDGTTAWQRAPGQAAATVLSGAAANQIIDQAINFIDLMADPEAKAIVTGSGRLDGHDYYKVQFTLPTGDAFTQYVDTHTWLVFHEEYPGGIEEISDYRKVGGLLLPYRYVSGPVGQKGSPLTRDTSMLNEPMAAGLFQKPE
ncbi:MAG TPA: hypothetical protein VN709_10980 [Terriglobales bacterium]|nr:hypothetical protein [Terriglobales bacterium]